MRPIGINTLPQRLAGLANMASNGRAPAGAGTAGLTSMPAPTEGTFGAAFSEQLQAQADAYAQAAGLAGGQAGMPMQHPGTANFASAGYAPAYDTGFGAAPTLGAGVRLTGQSSLITPQLPGIPGTVEMGHEGHAHVHAPPALDRQGPPPELQAYGNGRIPAEALAPIGIGNHRLWAPAGHAFQDMLAAAARDGVTIGVTDSYRDYDTQVRLAAEKGLYSQGGLAARPGTSNHGWGVALDLDLDDRAQAWMREHAADYGFVEDVPREPWHWTFKASTY